MRDLKRVFYTAVYNNHTYFIECWEGTTLGEIWNVQKHLYLPGAIVMIKDNHGHAKEFIRGMI